MNIKNFEKDVDSKIASRGKEYFSGGAVLCLEESDTLCYEALVAGTDDYTVTVSLAKNGDIIDIFCNCPYDFGEVCKHEVAALLAVRNDMEKPTTSKPKKSKNEKMNLKELLEAQPKETLVDLLYSMAEDNRALRQALLLRFSKQANELELSRKLIQEHIRRHKKRGYIEWNEIDSALTGAWEVLGRAEDAAQSDSFRAVRLCFIILHEVFEMLGYCDDSNGSAGEVIARCMETVRRAVAPAESSLPKHSREELFDMIAKEAKREVYKGWATYRLSFWECLMPMSGDPALYQKLWNILEKERNGRENYYEESIAWVQLRLLTQWDSEEKRREFLLDHLQYHDFRQRAIDEAMKRSDYDSALRYAQAGLAQDEEQRHPGYVREWHVATFEAYKAMGNTEKMRELAEYFVKHERDGIIYYSVLKEITPPAVWIETLLGLLEFFETDRYPSHTYTEILIIEKDFERLMSFCRRYRSQITEFAALFPKKHLNEVEQLYRALIIEQTKVASDRSMYKKICQLLENFGSVCGNAVMGELVQKIRAEHLRRPAFLDELGKLRQP